MKAKPNHPWDLKLALHDAAAVRAMAAAHPAAYAVVIEKICRAEFLEFKSGGDDGRRASDFCSGARWVGLMLKDIRDAAAPVNTRGAPPGVVEPPAVAPKDAKKTKEVSDAAKSAS